MLIKIATIRNVKTPDRGHATDAGMDFFCPEFDEQFIEDIKSNPANKISLRGDPGNALIITPGSNAVIPSGVKIEIPFGHMGAFFNKSGVATKLKLMVGAQIIDTFYSGEVHIDLHNVGTDAVLIEPGMKLAQLVMIPVVNAEPTECDPDDLYFDMKEGSFRNEDGFGSTDNKKD